MVAVLGSLTLGSLACNTDPNRRMPPALNNRGTAGVTASISQKKQQVYVAQVQSVPLTQQLNEAMAAGEDAKALALLDELEKLGGVPADYLALNRFKVLLHSNNTDAAYRLAARAEQLPLTDGTLYNGMARAILETPNVAERDLVLARRYARAAKAFNDKPDEYAATLDAAMKAK
jgi:hypothetical protein